MVELISLFMNAPDLSITRSVLKYRSEEYEFGMANLGIDSIHKNTMNYIKSTSPLETLNAPRVAEFLETNYIFAIIPENFSQRLT